MDIRTLNKPTNHIRHLDIPGLPWTCMAKRCKLVSRSRDVSVENFPIQGRKSHLSMQYALLRHKEACGYATISGLTNDLKRNGFFPFDIRELMAFAMSGAPIAMNSSAVALASCCRIHHIKCCPCLFRDGDGIHLLTFSFESGFDDSCLFLAKKFGDYR